MNVRGGRAAGMVARKSEVRRVDFAANTLVGPLNEALNYPMNSFDCYDGFSAATQTSFTPAGPRSDRFRCGGRESNFLAAG